MKIILFALDDIFTSKWNEITCKELCDLCSKFNNMYIISRKELYMESEIKEFKAKCNKIVLKTSKVAQNKIERFKKFLLELRLDKIDQKIKFLKKSENSSHANIIKGLSQTISAFNIFLDTSSQDSESSDFYIKIYESVHLENKKILRTSREFQGKEWYSNVAVTPAED
ncbi:hypothetical protein C1645_739487 [Glomus cerebriforme]|uniref:Uncharacterized protein n=1 Tax=Glomus cerebriforme TaxID=658196 RepID=A0A397SRH5_9GLOM|nr:hypothetical protein C1645_739487 [Glomus cerebriforme]